MAYSLNSAIPSNLNIKPVWSKELAFERQSDLAGAKCGGRVKIIAWVTDSASGISLGVTCGAVRDCAHSNS